MSAAHYGRCRLLISLQAAGAEPLGPKPWVAPGVKRGTRTTETETGGRHDRNPHHATDGWSRALATAVAERTDDGGETLGPVGPWRQVTGVKRWNGGSNALLAPSVRAGGRRRRSSDTPIVRQSRRARWFRVEGCRFAARARCGSRHVCKPWAVRLRSSAARMPLHTVRGLTTGYPRVRWDAIGHKPHTVPGRMCSRAT